MNGRAVRFVPYLLAFFSSLCIMILELVASRLVARHVGASLSVWTSVIGIMLGGICLGNVLGGRLADRIDPARALGPLYALGSALTLGCLWVNAGIGLLPGLHYLPLSLETVLVVSLDFLIPGTVLGMIGPVVAKMAVEQARHSGGALGDVYFFGAVGSIAGTFLAGFVLMYLAPTSTIVALVAAALAVLAAALFGEVGGVLLGLGTAVALSIGAFLTMTGRTSTDVNFGSLIANAPTLVGTVLAIGLAGTGLRRLRTDSTAAALVPPETPGGRSAVDRPVNLNDLSALAFIASLAFMALEMTAGRLVTRNLGSSIYGWTSVIGVLLGGLSLGNWLGGKIANRARSETAASHLFLVASILTAGILLAETPRPWMVRNPIEYFFQNQPGRLLASGEPGRPEPFLDMVSHTVGWPWGLRILFWVSIEFLLPAVAMGTVSPVVAKLAVERVRAQTKGTGAAIGQVYAWGMVGSILGTFLTGFLLINVFGTKGVVLLLATGLAIAATVLGTVGHAAWAGIPLGLCVIAFLPSVLPAKSGVKPLDTARAFLLKQGQSWGLRDESYDTVTPRKIEKVRATIATPGKATKGAAKIDATDPVLPRIALGGDPATGEVWTVWLDDKAFSYRVGDGDDLLTVARGLAERIESGPDNPYTARTIGDPAKDGGAIITVSKDSGIAYLDESNYYYTKITEQKLTDGERRTLVLDNLIHGYFIKDHPERLDYDYEHIYALVTRRVMEAKARAAKAGKPEGQPLATLFLGGGSYTFPRYLQHEYPRTTADVAEIDPAVTEANHLALWLPRDTTIKTTWGDARQFVANKTGVKYDLIFGDAFNDFSVPWHLTTKEFNDKINGLLTDDGVYMINIIDLYLGDRQGAFNALDRGVNGYLGERAAIEKALTASGLNDAKTLADAIVMGLDRKGLGVNTARLARVASAAVAKVDRIVPEDQLRRVIQAAYEKEKVPIRGTMAEIKAAIEEVISEDEAAQAFTSRIPEWAATAAEADRNYADDPAVLARDAARAIHAAREFGSFLGSWVETARKSFGPNVYVFGTATKPGDGQRETFVVVASRKPLDLDDLGVRGDDPHFFEGSSGALVAPEAYDESHMAAVKLRSRGIILTDDYAPVENLLAPVAKTRAEDDD